MAKITYSAKVENSGATDDGLARAANFNEIKSVVNGLDDAIALREPMHAYAEISAATTVLATTHNRGRLRFINAAPTLQLQTQAAAEYPLGFAVEGFADNALTVTAPSGVKINGVNAASIVVPASVGGVTFSLIRRISNDFVLAFQNSSGVSSFDDLSGVPSVLAALGGAGDMAEARGALGLGSVNNTSDLDKLVSTATQTALDLKLDADALPAEVVAAIAAAPSTFAAALGLGTAAFLNAEDRDTATAYHILARRADGMAETGVAADQLISGTQTLTPVAGDVTQLYPLDPAVLAGRLPEVAEAEASRPLNALAPLTAANSAANVHLLVYPDPVDTDVLAGLENRVLQSRLINTDEAATLTVRLAPYAPGIRRARWRGVLNDVELAPADELLARAHWFGGELDIDQMVRRAVWADIALVAGSAGVTAGLARSVPNALTADFVIAQAVRIGGQSIGLPSDKGYAHPVELPYGTDGRLLQPAPNRSTRVVWTWATADGTFATGNFTSSTAQIIAGGYRNVGAVRQIAAAYSDGNTSVDWPALPLARAPKSWVIGIVNATQAGFAPSPTGSTVDASYPNAGATNLTLWHFGDGQAYAPSSTTVPSCAWACTVLEVTPRRIS